MFHDRADELAKDATSLVKWMKDADPSLSRDLMRVAYTESLRSVYIMTGVVAFIATVASFFINHYDLDQVHETEHGLEIGEMKEAERMHIEKGRVVRTGTKSGLHRQMSVR